jgi:hypothetical protein
MAVIVQQVQPGTHAGQGKKERQQQHRDQHVKTLPQSELPVGNAGEANPGEKGAEERMDADLVRSRSGEQRSGYHHAQ